MPQANHGDGDDYESFSWEEPTSFGPIAEYKFKLVLPVHVTLNLAKLNFICCWLSNLHSFKTIWSSLTSFTVLLSKTNSVIIKLGQLTVSFLNH